MLLFNNSINVNNKYPESTIKKVSLALDVKRSTSTRKKRCPVKQIKNLTRQNKLFLKALGLTLRNE